MPTGFKNGTDGGITVASHAMKSASHPHHHMGISHSGSPVMISTVGNPDTHLVLRGGRGVTDYDELSIAKAVAEPGKGGVSTAVTVDSRPGKACNPAGRTVEDAR